MNRILFLLLLSMSLLVAPACGQQYEHTQDGFEQMVDGLLDHSVPEVRVADLKEKPQAILLDAREKGEFKVSHIEGARWIGYDDFDATRVADVPKDQEIVVYCSVGYRSEKISEQLKSLGYTNVCNLYGGIFDWVNHEMPVVDKKEKPTNSVHPYNEDWGQWVFKGEKDYK